jgi:hypothetical protein
MREKILLSLFFLCVFMIFKCKGRGLLSPDFRKDGSIADGSIADEEKIPIKIECTPQINPLCQSDSDCPQGHMCSSSGMCVPEDEKLECVSSPQCDFYTLIRRRFHVSDKSCCRDSIISSHSKAINNSCIFDPEIEKEESVKDCLKKHGCQEQSFSELRVCVKYVMPPPVPIPGCINNRCIGTWPMRSSLRGYEYWCDNNHKCKKGDCVTFSIDFATGLYLDEKERLHLCVKKIPYERISSFNHCKLPYGLFVIRNENEWNYFISGRCDKCPPPPVDFNSKILVSMGKNLGSGCDLEEKSLAVYEGSYSAELSPYWKNIGKRIIIQSDVIADGPCEAEIDYFALIAIDKGDFVVSWHL